MNILYLGDIMGKSGIDLIERELPNLKRDYAIDFVIAQGENVTDGKGISLTDYRKLRDYGIDAFTGGNHTTYRPEINDSLEDINEPIVGPANMKSCPGKGYKFIKTHFGDILIISLLGSVVGKQASDPTVNPLKKIDEILEETAHHFKVATIVNYHGDYSSEKLIIGHYLDGRVSAVIGDHWHVQTADEQILKNGTAHISDVGMCGSLDSSLGVKFDILIDRWRDNIVNKNELESSGRMQICGLVISIDPNAQNVTNVERIRKVFNN